MFSFSIGSNKSAIGGGNIGVANQSFDIREDDPNSQLNNSRVPLQPPPTSKPDIIEAQESMQRQLPPSRFNNDNANFDNMAEHYDIENASSIAPSDIDIVYHYKGEYY